MIVATHERSVGRSGLVVSMVIAGSSSGPVVCRGRRLVQVWFVRLRWLFVQTATAVALTALVLTLSVFFYGAFYYVYVPVKAHEWPLQLRFRTDCDVDNRLCSFPMANISLMTSSEKPMLVHGQAYVVSVEIEMPESSVNQHLGMFLVQIQFYAKHGDVIFTRSRSAILQYKSYIQRTVETIVYLPFLIFRSSSSATQTVTTELTNNYVEDPYRPSVGAVVEVHNKKVEIYNMMLKIHARFSGLRYLMYYWPLLSAIIGISSNFFFLSIVVFFSWLAFAVRSSVDLREQTDGKDPDENKKLNDDDDQETVKRFPSKDNAESSNVLSHERLSPVRHKESAKASDSPRLRDDKQLTSSLRKRNL